MSEDDFTVYEALGARLAELGLAYLHVLAAADDPIVGKLRAIWPGTFVLDTGLGSESDRDALERSGDASPASGPSPGAPAGASVNRARGAARG